MEDIINSIKAFLYDRASSPLFGAFIISWIAWNYRVLLILFSDKTYELKFHSIDTYIASHVPVIPWLEITTCFTAGSGFIYPLLTALTYIYIYPYAAEPVYKHSLEKQKSINKLKKEAGDSKIIDEKNKEDIGEQQYLSKVTDQKLLEAIESRGLNFDVNASEKIPLSESYNNEKLSDKDGLVDIVNDDLSSNELKLLIVMSHDPNWKSIDNMKGTIKGGHRLVAKSSLEDLVKAGYSESNNDGKHYKITPKGEEYLLDHKLI